MGMFDYIRSEIPLPDGFDGELQTKDFDCQMGVHIINKDRRLILSVLDHCEEVPMEERPYPNGDGLLKWAGSVRNIWRNEDSNFHGVINFYGYDEDNKRHGYNAKFTDGNLVFVEIVNND